MATVGLIPEAIHKYPQVSIIPSLFSDKSTNLGNDNTSE